MEAQRFNATCMWQPSIISHRLVLLEANLDDMGYQQCCFFWIIKIYVTRE